MRVWVDSTPMGLSGELLLTLVGKSSALVKLSPEAQQSMKMERFDWTGEVPILNKGDRIGKNEVKGIFDVCKEVAPDLIGVEKTTQKWIKFVADEFDELFQQKGQKFVGKLHKFNKDLALNTFWEGHKLTIVDLLFFPYFHSLMKTWQDTERALFYNITRWFDFVQHQPGIEGMVDSLPLLKINKNLDFSKLDSTPASSVQPSKEKKKPESKKEEQKKDKKDTQTVQTEKKENQEKKKKKDDQKSKNKKGDNKKKQPEAPVDISRLNIRVGKIMNVKVHEEADTLYVEEIDVGEETPRTIVSGLKNFIPLEEMKGRLVAVLCNLKPASMRGVKSCGMVLAASNDDHTKVELVEPPTGSKPGERITFDGYEGEPDAQLNPKKKVFEQIQPDLHTTADCQAAYKTSVFKTSSGICTVKSIKNGKIK